MSMNNNSNQQNLCKQGCGFYGNAQNMDMCSKCYQNFLKTSSQDESPRSQSQNLQQFSNSISINEIYRQSSLGHVDSEINQLPVLKERRKRAAHSDTEVMCKVPKTSCDDSDVHEAIFKQSSAVVGTTIDGNVITKSRSKITDDNESLERSSVNSQHSNSPIAKKPRRCLFCRRKVGLTGFDCRCGGHYCAVHRYSDKHSCTFDYQAQGQEQIKNQNPMICGSKIKKI